MLPYIPRNEVADSRTDGDADVRGHIFLGVHLLLDVLIEPEVDSHRRHRPDQSHAKTLVELGHPASCQQIPTRLQQRHPAFVRPSSADSRQKKHDVHIHTYMNVTEKLEGMCDTYIQGLGKLPGYNKKPLFVLYHIIRMYMLYPES